MTDAASHEAIPLYQVIEEECDALSGRDHQGAPAKVVGASIPYWFAAAQILEPQDFARKIYEIDVDEGQRARKSGPYSTAAQADRTKSTHPLDPVTLYLLRLAPQAGQKTEVASAESEEQRAVVLEKVKALRAAHRMYLADHCRLDAEPERVFRSALADRLNAALASFSLSTSPEFRRVTRSAYVAELQSDFCKRRDTGAWKTSESERRALDADCTELNRLLLEAAFPTQLQRYRDIRLEAVYERMWAGGHAALCLSGGGMRSATFGLGVIQGLARHGILRSFDYLSTVSGGGYVGGWLTAWMAHAGPQYVEAQLASGAYEDDETSKAAGKPGLAAAQARVRRTAANPGPSLPKLEPEPAPTRHLRAYSNFLSPRVGFLSADGWTLVATYLRNLLLNWLVLVPILAAAVMAPWAAVAGVNAHAKWYFTDFLAFVALLLGVAGIGFIHADPRSDRAKGGKRSAPRSENRFILVCLLPLTLSGICGTTAWYYRVHSDVAEHLLEKPHYWLWFAMTGVVLHGGAWVVALRRKHRDRDGKEAWFGGLAAALTGFGVGYLTYLIAVGLERIGTLAPAYESLAYVTLALPAFLAMLTLGGQLFLGFVSRWTEDPEREWGARFNAWMFIVSTTWLVFSAIVLFGPVLAHHYATALWQQLVAGGVGGASALTTVLLGGSSKTAGKQGADPAREPAAKAPGVTGLIRKYAMVLAMPVLVVSIIVLLSLLDAEALGVACYWIPLSGCTLNEGMLGAALAAPFVISLIVVLVYLGLGVLLGHIVDTNKFSLHAMYRARLIRGFLGASRPAGERRPDPFTGFDDNDNLRMHQLWPAASAPTPLEVDVSARGAHGAADAEGSFRARSTRPPIPIVNMALNLVANPNLAWQERKAASFTVSPLHAGSLFVGYRRTSPRRSATDSTAAAATDPVHADNDTLFGGGMSLGTAVTISGAAASPNAGYHSSPLVTFLLTLFNARLGAWVGNPGPSGDSTFHLTSPRTTALSIIKELFGFTDDRAPYVFLSDGGHFDNLGLYEMVLRRCRYIVVSDASCDASCSFEDLGNAIRRIRVDLGIPIEFDEEIPIYPREHEGQQKVGKYWAIGRIRYSAVDRYAMTKKQEAAEAPATNGTAGHGNGASGNGAAADAAEVDVANSSGKPMVDTGDGVLIYIKPAFYADREPRDVYNYAKSNPSFPHENTIDQFYSESQFESYRALGRHIIDLICENDKVAHTIADMEPARDKEPLPWLQYRMQKPRVAKA